MGYAVSNLVNPLRVMIGDNNTELQQFTDSQLVSDYLVTCIKVENATLSDLGVSVQNTSTTNTPKWEFVSQPQEWLEIFYCIATALRYFGWQERFSYDNGVMKVTNNNIKDVVASFKQTYDQILEEHKYNCAAIAYTTWDDFFTRYNLVLNEINEGFR